MAITQIIATLPAVLNDSATFYEDIAERNNSLVTVSFPSVNTWATQANALAVEINDKAAQVAAQAVDGGYSQTYINTNFVGVNNAQNITAIKTFMVSPIVPNATTSTQAMAYGQGVNLTATQTIAGIKTFSSFPVTPSTSPTTDYQVVNKKYVDDNNKINTLINKTTPAVADELVIADSASAFSLKKLSFTDLINFVSKQNIAFSAYQTASNTSLTTNITTKILLTTEAFDPNSQYDNINSKFQPTVAGYYHIEGVVRFGAASFNGEASAQIYKNGVVYAVDIKTPVASAAIKHYSHASTIVYLNGITDFVELYCVANGTALVTVGGGTASTTLNGFLVRRT